MSRMDWNVEQNRRRHRSRDLPVLAPWQEDKLRSMQAQERCRLWQWREQTWSKLDRMTRAQLKALQASLPDIKPSQDDTRNRIRSFEMLRMEVDRRINCGWGLRE